MYDDFAVEDGWKWADDFAAQGIRKLEEFLAKQASFAEYLEQRDEVAHLNEILEGMGEPPVDPKELAELVRSVGGF